MASDIVLVLRSDHRHLLLLADQCDRISRGLHDPVTALRLRVQAHITAASSEIYPTVRSLCPPNAPDLLSTVERVGHALGDETLAREELAEVTRDLVGAERADVLLLLAAQLPIGERRRMGRVFRIRRDAVLRSARTSQHRARSQTELYELARRAGVGHRSTMTLSQLQEAVTAWENDNGRGIGAAG